MQLGRPEQIKYHEKSCGVRCIWPKYRKEATAFKEEETDVLNMLKLVEFNLTRNIKILHDSI